MINLDGCENESEAQPSVSPPQKPRNVLISSPDPAPWRNPANHSAI
jgi:hypothetical protein